ncbi:hypothetical protein [Mesorhizobium sp.]|uniref:hypothetical protein n=1 Tax=Mesorhizobium sp. TaxID=1871066 RepID=UPI001219AF81|nr:hypothetical protein [Mesorhizobium sp.]TIP13170.1 MAG: hypothetical protein E5X73_10085 [Mesorhizobium sp.]
MTPTLVHRYAFPIREAIEQLLGDAVGDCEAWRIRVEADEVVIDVVGPSEVTFRIGDYEYTVDGRSGQEAKNEAAKINMEGPAADAQPAEPPRKGGPLAQRAAISCGEKGFWTFIGKKHGATVQSADEAAAWLKSQCGIKSRVDLDYDDGPAQTFREIDKSYRLWLEGYD